jgi:hypothetical protein
MTENKNGDLVVGDAKTDPSMQSSPGKAVPSGVDSTAYDSPIPVAKIRAAEGSGSDVYGELNLPPVERGDEKDLLAF